MASGTCRPTRPTSRTTRHHAMSDHTHSSERTGAVASSMQIAHQLRRKCWISSRRNMQQNAVDNAQMPITPATNATSFVENTQTNPRDKQKTFALSNVSDDAIKRAAVLGIDLTGKVLALDHDSVIHAMKGHSGQNEYLRGQVPIDAQDIAAFDRIFNSAELRVGTPPIAKDSTRLLAGNVALDGWIYSFAAKVRKNYVSMQTLFKRKKK